MDKKDKTLVCQDCGKEFIFTAGEQEFYATKEMAIRRRGTKLEFDPTIGKMILNKKRM